MRIAITGGSGFIGSHVVDRVLREGHEVVVLDGAPPHRDDVEHIVCDILDLDALVSATRGCDVIFHLAAVSNVNVAFDHPVETVQLNVTGTANVWEAARRNRVGRAVLASTVWVYTGATGDLLDEEAPFHLPSAGHVYTSSKIASELVVHNYFDLYGQPFTILRYGIPFGPRMRDELVIARFVQAALAGEAITIHGDGNQFRNYVYVEDLADAHVLALGEAGENQVFNLEGPEPVSLRQIVDAIRDIVAPDLVVEYLPARTGDYKGKVVSAEKVARVLGWVASTPFVEGLRRYIDWRSAPSSGPRRQGTGDPRR